MEKEKLVGWVTNAQNGDCGAMEQLFSAFYNDIYYFALKTVKDSDTACDITQETFLEIVNTIGDLNEPAAFVTWMKQIAYHQCTRYFKKKKEVLVEEDEDGNTIFDTLADEREGVIPAEVYEQTEFRSTILGIINELSEEQRSAVMLYYFDELSVSQVAKIQGVSDGTVKSRLNYARKAIKRSVEDYEKKHDVKLHSVALLPLFALYFGKGIMPKAKAAQVGAVVAEAAAAGTAATAAASASAAGVGLMAKIAAMPLMTKIVAAVAAVAAVAVTVGGVALVSEPETPAVVPTTQPATNPSQASTPTTQSPAPTTQPHEHSYTGTQTQYPACEAVGIMTYTCDCGHSYTENTPATDHTWDAWQTLVQPAWNAEGLAIRYCVVCGKSENQLVDPLTLEEALIKFQSVLSNLPTFDSVNDLAASDLFHWLHIHAGRVYSNWDEETFLVTNIYSLDAFDSVTMRYFGRTYDYMYMIECNDSMTYDAENNQLIWITGGAGGGFDYNVDTIEDAGDGHYVLHYHATEYEEENILFTGKLYLVVVESNIMIEAHEQFR